MKRAKSPARQATKFHRTYNRLRKIMRRVISKGLKENPVPIFYTGHSMGKTELIFQRFFVCPLPIPLPEFRSR